VVVRSLVRIVCIAGSMASLCALPALAQEKSTKDTKAANPVPESAQPPAGLCRVWLDNVPASQQPAPTDCATAIRNRPSNGRLLFGDLRDEAAKPPQNHAVDAPRRFDTSPGIPSHQSENVVRQNEAGGVHQLEAGGVHPVNATVTRPSPDSGAKSHRPEH
jgi:hypothetical protein